MRIARTLTLASSALAFAGTLLVAAPAARANGVPDNMSPPSLSGTAQVGADLMTSNGTWVGNPTSYTYQWQRCADEPAVVTEPTGLPCTDVDGATDSTYTPVTADVGSRMRAVVTAHNTNGSSTPVSSDLSDPVIADLPTGPAPVITGTARVGETLTATVGPWTGGGGSLTTAWSWARCAGLGACSEIEGASAPTYLVTAADVGLSLVARVDVTGPGGTDGAPSEPTAVVIPAPAASGPENVSASGDSITVTGSGFGPDTDVTVILRSDPVTLGVVRTDAAGAFTATFPLPAGVLPGAHVLVFMGFDAAGNPIVIEQAITVAGTGTLPVTGSDDLALALAAGGLLLAGAVALRTSRRLAPRP